VKLRESTALLEFIADTFPNAHLLPEDPILRANARLFMTIMVTKFMPAWYGYYITGREPERFIAVLEDLQALLPPSGFIAGEWSIANAHPAAVSSRILVVSEHGLKVNGVWSDGGGRAVLDVLHSPRFERFMRYRSELMDRPNFKATDPCRLTLPKSTKSHSPDLTESRSRRGPVWFKCVMRGSENGLCNV